MQFYIISYTLFFFLMVMTFPSLIYAWTKDDPPKTPPNSMENDCAHWIEYNGFKLDDYPYNRNKATTRDYTLDKKASTWAAAYAFKIGGLGNIYQISPKVFCNSLDGNNSVPMKFLALENDKKVCRDWILFYGFKITVFDNDSKNYIFNIDASQLKHISIWAYSYYVYISYCEEDHKLQPWEFCSKLGSLGDFSEPKQFACKHDSLLTCMEWLEQYEYTVKEEPWDVLQKVLLLMKKKSEYPLLHLHYFPTTYGKELMDLDNSGQLVWEFTQEVFCKKYDGEGDEAKKYPFDYSGEN